MTASDESWRQQARCKGVSTASFFSESGSQGIAKAVCRGCPVKAPCLAFALAIPETVGVWGATSADERRRMRRAGAA